MFSFAEVPKGKIHWASDGAGCAYACGLVMHARDRGFRANRRSLLACTVCKRCAKYLDKLPKAAAGSLYVCYLDGTEVELEGSDAVLGPKYDRVSRDPDVVRAIWSCAPRAYSKAGGAR